MSHQPSLWDQALEDAATRRRRDIERLIPIAQELAERAGEHGVTVADLRIEAVRRHILTGEEKDRALSFLGAVMRKANLVATGRTRRSKIGKSHGNPHVVWVHPRFARAA